MTNLDTPPPPQPENLLRDDLDTTFGFISSLSYYRFGINNTNYNKPVQMG